MIASIDLSSEPAAKVARHLGSLLLNLFDFGHILRKQRLVHVAQINDFAVWPSRKFFGEMAAATAKADNGQPHAIVCRVGLWLAA